MKKSNLAIIILALVSISSASYFYQGSIEMQKELAKSSKQCEANLASLSEKYDEELERIQDEMDRAASQQNVLVREVTYTVESEPEAEQIAKPQLEHYDESLEDIVRRKYRFLFSKLKLSTADMEALLALLIQREEVALKIQDIKMYGDELGIAKNDLYDLEYRLEELDAQIDDLLEDENGEHYALLKNSDKEQAHFNQYTLGVNGLFPLDNKQQEAVLFTRLKHKQEFEDAFKNTGFNEEHQLSKEQAEKLYKDLEMVAMRYKHKFLQEIRSELDHSNYPMDQYTMLENYTNTEFKQLLDKFKEKIDQRKTL